MQSMLTSTVAKTGHCQNKNLDFLPWLFITFYTKEVV